MNFGKKIMTSFLLVATVKENRKHGICVLQSKF